MKITFKTLLIFSISIVLVFLSLQSFAQPRGMTMNQVYSQINKQTMNQQMQFMRQMQMMNNMRGVTSSNEEFTFQVIMRDSTNKEITSAIYRDSISHQRFIIWTDKRFKKSDTNRYKKIYPFQTLSLKCVLPAKDDDSSVSYLPTKITDSCWLFKTLSGPINGYCDKALDSNGAPEQSYLTGIQLKDGPILSLTPENLRSMVGQNTKALELIDEKKYIKAIKKYNKDNEQK